MNPQEPQKPRDDTAEREEDQKVHEKGPASAPASSEPRPTRPPADE